jgi:hypothetical protein
VPHECHALVYLRTDGRWTGREASGYYRERYGILAGPMFVDDLRAVFAVHGVSMAARHRALCRLYRPC